MEMEENRKDKKAVISNLFQGSKLYNKNIISTFYL